MKRYHHRVAVAQLVGQLSMNPGLVAQIPVMCLNVDQTLKPFCHHLCADVKQQLINKVVNILV